MKLADSIENCSRLLLLRPQEKENALRRERDSLSRAKDRWERERAKAAQNHNQELSAAVRRAEAERYVCAGEASAGQYSELICLFISMKKSNFPSWGYLALEKCRG